MCNDAGGRTPWPLVSRAKRPNEWVDTLVGLNDALLLLLQASICTSDDTEEETPLSISSLYTNHQKCPSVHDVE